MDIDVVRAWIEVADRDLILIRKAMAEPDPEPAGASFHCQQAAEKLVKTVLVAAGINPPKTHDIQILVELLPADHELRAILVPLCDLTEFATAYRYPSSNLFGDPPEFPTVDEVGNWLGQLQTIRSVIVQFLEFPA